MERLAIIGGGTFFVLYAWHDKAPNGFHLFWTGVRITFELAIAALVAWGVWRLAKVVFPVLKDWFEASIRLYYFAVRPHPAAPLIETAMRAGAPLDGQAIATALGEMPASNRILRSVRMEQAERLVQEMQEVNAARLQAMQKEAVAEYERAAVASSQEAIALAAVALERTRAAYQASQLGGGHHL